MTLNHLNIRFRGWLGWKLYEAGMRQAGHRISPEEVPDSAPAIARATAAVARNLAAQGVSVAELSRRTGISHRSLRRRLAGRGGSWYVNELGAIADALNVDVVELFREMESVG